MMKTFTKFCLTTLLAGLAFSVNAQIGPEINEDFATTKSMGYWAVNQSTGNTRNSTITQNPITGVITIVPSYNGSKYRGDFYYNTTTGGSVSINPGTHPIIAIKITKPSTGNIIFDTSAGAYFKSGSGNQNNQYTALGYDNVYYYDLTDGSGAKLGTKEINTTNFTYPISLTTFQLKIADLTVDESYDIYWVKAFTSVADLTAYVESTLPVSLTAYQVKQQGNTGVAVSWSVTSEQNNEYFKIERKTGNGAFTQIATIDSHGSASSSYNYTDHGAANGINYYRLSQVDLDGTVKELGIKSIDFSLPGLAGLYVYPNPASGSTIYLKNITTHSEKINVRIVSVAGERLYDGTAELSTAGMYKVDIGHKPTAGLYLVYINGYDVRKVLFN